MELAQQIYNYVDERIRATDASLRAFDGELARERRKLGLPPPDTTLFGSAAGGGGGAKQGKQKKRKQEAEAVAAAIAPPNGAGSPALPALPLAVGECSDIVGTRC